MKALLLAGALLLEAARVAPAVPAPPVAPAATQKLAIVFTRQTDFAQLATLRQNLVMNDGILLDYEKLEFSPGGELLRIRFRVNCRDGYEGTASSDELPAGLGTDGVLFGFIRDYTPGSRTPFRIGRL